ncbi:hypothetical protein BKA62DRAFT_724179 [Auriculariales sp. MPI-PUGE-AT-0066]|nr:hypothetical protein BKA62DRAFT_724179 [Auriculariales sp. MPI-PUGE-AT-0066]
MISRLVVTAPRDHRMPSRLCARASKPQSIVQESVYKDSLGCAARELCPLPFLPASFYSPFFPCSRRRRYLVSFAFSLRLVHHAAQRLFSFALLAAAVIAAPVKRQEKLATSANIKVVTSEGKSYDLLDTGKVNFSASSSSTDPTTGIPTGNLPIAPVPAGRFTVTPVQSADGAKIVGTDEDMLVSLSTFTDSPCRLAGDSSVLTCFGATDADGPVAVFRAKLGDDGVWKLLGGYESFSVDALGSGDGTTTSIGGTKSISPMPTFDIKAELVLSPIDGGMSS